MATHRPILGFKNRLLLIFFFLMLLPLLVVGLLSYHYYHSEAWDKTTFAADQAIGELTRELEAIFSDAENFQAMASHAAVEKYLAGRGDAYANAKEILGLMQLYRGRHHLDDDIRNIYLVGMNGVGISEREGVFRLQRPFSEIAAFRRLEHGNPGDSIITFDRHDLSGYWEKADWQRAALDGAGPALGLARLVMDPIRKETLGVAVVEIDPDRINRLIREQNAAGDLKFFIFDRAGQLLFNGAKRNLSREWPNIWEKINRDKNGRFVSELAGKEIFFVHNLSESTGWRVVGEVDLDVMMARAYRIRTITAISVIGCFVFTLFLYALLSARLTKPLRLLQDKMRLAAQGDMEVRFHSPVRDEIADLGDSFNTMIGKIDELMRQSLREQEELKKAEFRALQSQINPHFLYNTLDAIIWMAQASRREELTEIVMALSKFFRLTLNGGREVVTIGEEVEHVSNYLIIQRMRYHDILDYEFDVDPRLKRFQMIKLTLQPLVENAIYHGLKTKRGGGKIWIEGDYDEANGTAAFMIRDNGAGMARDRLDEVRREMSAGAGNAAARDTEEGGYALRNVNGRMRLLYGAGYGLTIDSGENEGTVVTMLFPARELNHV